MTTRHATTHRDGFFFQISDRVYGNLALLAQKAGAVPNALRQRLGYRPAPQGSCTNRCGAACVLRIIGESGAGVHPHVLAQMTGFDRQKLDRILHTLFTDGRIMVAPGGVYTPARPLNSHRLRDV